MSMGIPHDYGAPKTLNPVGSSELVSRQARAAAIIQDLLTNHLPRVAEGLRKGYVDENQILVMYDHAVRARILQEHAD